VRGWKPRSVGREGRCRLGLLGAAPRHLRGADAAELLGDLGVSESCPERDGDPEGEMMRGDSLEI